MQKKYNYSDGGMSHVNHEYGIMSPSFIFIKDQNKKSL